MNDSEIIFALGRLEGKVDALRGQQEQIDRLDTRVTKLERWQIALIGGGSVIGVIVAAFWDLLPHFLR